ncbi:MAG: TetR family transcriptional regulator [Clostridiales bacterium]|nr:TetR family transcriptional regulator [Clostridiales bacterium]
MSESNITKKALASTMKELMMNTPFSKISVSDICELCGMHRKSFYYHFKDKYDLVNWIFYHDFIEITIKNQPPTFSELYRRLCTYFYENRTFYKNALSVTGQNSFGEYYQELFQATVKAYFEDEFPENDNLDLLSQYCSEISLATLTKWLRSNPCPPPDEYFSLMRGIVKGLSLLAAENEE